MMGKFSFIYAGMAELFVVEPFSYKDDRGYFMEVFNRKDFLEFGIKADFVQDNQSRSVKGVLRGLHFQKKYPQAKLVRVVSGEIFDVAVDLRRSSKTFGKWEGLYLSAENKRQFYIPPGFAHGFLVVSETAEVSYKCTEYYHPEDEYGIIWNDPNLGIKWPLEVHEPIISAKDAGWGCLRNVINV